MSNLPAPEELKKLEEKTLAGLKDFQRATVMQVMKCFQNHHNRVLVADEVGLGKTLIAKGVIASTARWHREEGDELFKVVYVCSNQNIADQNLRKLIIAREKDFMVDRIADSRLSMQHLKIFQQEYQNTNGDSQAGRYFQLIPLTPATSFSLKSSGGTKAERALILAVLNGTGMLQDYGIQYNSMKSFLKFDRGMLEKNWEWNCNFYREQVEKCDCLSGGDYLSYMRTKLSEALTTTHTHLINQLIENCEQIARDPDYRSRDAAVILSNLRVLFAEISINRLEPDLIIMDEFQRFKTLISADESSETSLLAKKFLSTSTGNKDPKVLLLSATPYKLYSTLEEMEDLQEGSPYAEFMGVMNFLMNNSEVEKQFQKKWNTFSERLREFTPEGFAVVKVAKDTVEQLMTNHVCRTERHIAEDAGNLIDNDTNTIPIIPQESDIVSYLYAQAIFRSLGIGSLPIEYAKSSPFLLSYLDKYQIKDKLEKSLKREWSSLSSHQKKLLKSTNAWLYQKKIQTYTDFSIPNSRFDVLKKIAFERSNELLLWVPPSLPCYDLEGAFKDKDTFSKILVFSSWEMVPRMIATLMSYELELKTLGKLKGTLKNIKYFTRKSKKDTDGEKGGKRIPAPRIVLGSIKKNQRHKYLTLLYPSRTLSQVFNPIGTLNIKLSVRELSQSIKQYLEERIASLHITVDDGGPTDARWYYLIPMLLDNQDQPGFTENWINAMEAGGGQLADEKSNLFKHLEKVKEELYDLPTGRLPEDLAEISTLMAVGSPAVCAYRSSNGLLMESSLFAKRMIDKFNSPESIAIVGLSEKVHNEEGHWKQVLRYCCEGCFQSVLDEWAHMVSEDNRLSSSELDRKFLYTLLSSYVNIRSAPIQVDAYENFDSRMHAVAGVQGKMSMRTHFAAGFYKTKNEEKAVSRKNALRYAFNSPFYPFVLATTSVGQEGLDFHYYCRRIMHWNLPSNPIDLEQREGRINRFKNFAIRKNLASRFGNSQFDVDVWTELFKLASEVSEGKSSDIIPFWGIQKSDDDDDNLRYKIERIVPQFTLSRDQGLYEYLLKVLTLYRITLGQPKQEELIERFGNLSKDEVKALFINLSPHYRSREHAKIFN